MTQIYAGWYGEGRNGTSSYQTPEASDQVLGVRIYSPFQSVRLLHNMFTA